MMESPDLLEVLERYRGSSPMVVAAGRRGREMRTIAGDDPLVLYNMDMPYATPVCLGLARTRPDTKVVALEGDGNVLAGLGGLSTIGRYQPDNLIVLVVDNESYGSFGTGAVTTATSAGVDLEVVARGCGIANACTVRDLTAAEDALQRAFSTPGPWVIVAKVANLGDSDARFWINPPDIVENAFSFEQALRANGAS
ncbi:MAG TPA: thiamine pyrophosphate-dependent enzyme [Chloroflexota bacterium]|jgi:phosphonopyruvate decarboxylase